MFPASMRAAFTSSSATGATASSVASIVTLDSPLPGHVCRASACLPQHKASNKLYQLYQNHQ
jgi:hypothetical protein